MLIRLRDDNYQEVKLSKIIVVDDIKIGIDNRNGTYCCTHYPTGILINYYHDKLKNVIPKITDFVRQNHDSIVNLASKQQIINKE